MPSAYTKPPSACTNTAAQDLPGNALNVYACTSHPGEGLQVLAEKQIRSHIANMSTAKAANIKAPLTTCHTYTALQV